MFKRVGLFILTNLAIIVVVSIIMSIFNVQPYLTQQGIDYRSLLIFAALFGFAGATVSLFISKWMAKRAYSIRIIDQPSNANESWLINQVKQLANKKHIGMPEVGIYESPEPNAFATGWNKNNSLVAVSTGLLHNMDEEELLGVLGHEVSHIANGDMVTMTLIQGVVNTFVIFFARIAAYAVATFLSRDNEEGASAISGFAYYGIAILFEIIFGILASTIVMAFSRWREFRADAGSARVTSKTHMIRALEKLKRLSEANIPEDNRAPAFNAMKINHRGGILALFASHPPIEKRIAALQR